MYSEILNEKQPPRISTHISQLPLAHTLSEMVVVGSSFAYFFYDLCSFLTPRLLFSLS